MPRFLNLLFLVLFWTTAVSQSSYLFNSRLSGNLISSAENRGLPTDFMLKTTRLIRVFLKKDSALCRVWLVHKSDTTGFSMRRTGISFSLERIKRSDSVKLNSYLALHKKLENLYFDTLDLSQLIHNRWNRAGDSIFINDTVIVKNCIIDQIRMPGQPRDSDPNLMSSSKGNTKDSVVVVFNEPVMFSDCSVCPAVLKNLCFKKDFVLLNNNLSVGDDFLGLDDKILGPQFVIDSSMFFGKVYLYNNISYEYPVRQPVGTQGSGQESARYLAFLYAHYYEPFFPDSLHPVRMQVLSIRNNSQFFNEVYINNSNPYKIIDLGNDKFKGALHIFNFYRLDIPLWRSLYPDIRSRSGSKDNVNLTLSNPDLGDNYNCNFENGDFYGKALIQNENCRDFDFYKSYFHSAID